MRRHATTAARLRRELCRSAAAGGTASADSHARRYSRCTAGWRAACWRWRAPRCCCCWARRARATAPTQRALLCRRLSSQRARPCARAALRDGLSCRACIRARAAALLALRFCRTGLTTSRRRPWTRQRRKHDHDAPVSPAHSHTYHPANTAYGALDAARQSATPAHADEPVSLADTRKMLKR